MVKELNIEKIIKKVQDASDKKIDTKLEKLVKRFEQKVEDVDKRAKSRGDGLIEEFQSRVSGIAEHYKDFNKRFDSIEKTLDSHSDRIANILMDLTEVKRDVKDIRYDVKIKLENKPDKKHFVDLDLRVRKLEKK